ncbi:MAG: hypothetical protein QM755_20525 [Luteolibacter sp.]
MQGQPTAHRVAEQNLLPGGTAGLVIEGTAELRHRHRAAIEEPPQVDTLDRMAGHGEARPIGRLADRSMQTPYRSLHLAGLGSAAESR